MRIFFVSGGSVGWDVLMCDGQRTFTVTMTNAQYDVLKAATDEIEIIWKGQGKVRSSHRHTLMRAMEHISKEFESGVRTK